MASGLARAWDFASTAYAGDAAGDPGMSSVGRQSAPAKTSTVMAATSTADMQVPRLPAQKRRGIRARISFTDCSVRTWTHRTVA